MALRLPGGVHSPDQLWDFIINKNDARSEIPATRFNASAFYSNPPRLGNINTMHGYFLDDSIKLGTLDTSFFRISKAEVELVDPQQKLLLELTRECFESAGEVNTNTKGQRIGVYIGSFGDDWAEVIKTDHQFSARFKSTGYGDFCLANRISYEYDLKGPSMTIKTACSS